MENPRADAALYAESCSTSSQRAYFPVCEFLTAEPDCLRFESGQFDMAIFNAAFHYSADWKKTLREVMRCVRVSGLVVVAHTPFYWRTRVAYRCWKNGEYDLSSSLECAPMAFTAASI